MREAVLNHIEGLLVTQVEEGEKALRSLQESLQSEAKSTAGDKHETGRAMIQAEMVRLNETLVRSKEALLRCRTLQHGGKAGWLYRTTGPWIFVGISMGKILVNDQVILVVGDDAPLAKSLQGKGVGSELTIGPSQFIIEEVAGPQGR